MTRNQSWAFVLSLFHSLLFCSFTLCSFALSLFALLPQIALFKERPWGIHSHCSLKKSDRELITLISLYKRATVSESLSSHCTLYKRVTRANCSCCSLRKSAMSDSFMICSFALKKWAILKKLFVVLTMFFWQFFTAFPLFIFNSNHKQFAPVAL